MQQRLHPDRLSFQSDLRKSTESEDFAREFAVAMGKVPIAQGRRIRSAGYRRGSLQIDAHRAQGWQKPELFIDTLEGSAFGKPVVKVEGEYSG